MVLEYSVNFVNGPTNSAFHVSRLVPRSFERFELVACSWEEGAVFFFGDVHVETDVGSLHDVRGARVQQDGPLTVHVSLHAH